MLERFFILKKDLHGLKMLKLGHKLSLSCFPTENASVESNTIIKEKDIKEKFRFLQSGGIASDNCCPGSFKLAYFSSKLHGRHGVFTRRFELFRH